MCMQCGCCSGNDGMVQAPMIVPNGSSGTTVVVGATDASPGGYARDGY